MMTRILIVYHSQTGKTEKMAREVAQGVTDIENAEVILKKAKDASLEDLLGCDGLAIGTPENFGYMSGAVKDYFDRTFYPSAGNDGTGALNSIERIALGYQFKKVYDPVIARDSKGGVTVEILAQCRELGQTIAGGCEAGIY